MLDLRTVIVSYLLSSVVCTGMIALLWRQHRRRYAGLGWWLAGFVAQLVGLALLIGRGHLPDLLSVVVGGALLLADFLFTYLGLQLFVGRRATQAHNVLLLALYVLLSSYFTFVQPSLLARTVSFSALQCLLACQPAWLLLRQAAPELRPATRWLGLAFAGYAMTALIRVAANLLAPPGEDFFQSGPFNTGAILIYQMLTIGVTLGLGGMVNRRLAADLGRDVAERQRVKEDVRVLSRTVEQSQVSVMITDTNGAIQYVNPKFSETTGYTLDEVRGQNPRMLRAVAAAPEVYRELWATILAGREWRGEFQNRKKNGELYWDATIISPIVNDAGLITHFVSMKEDVTERAEEAALKLAAMEERQRLARDLHDSVSQSIHSLVLFAETLTAVLERQQFDQARHLAERMQVCARQALKEMRLLLYQIRLPLAASGADLIQNLELRLAAVERRAGMQVDIRLEGSLDDCPPAWIEQLFGIATEALNNALKHAQACTVHVLLRGAPRLVELEVVDDGRGFDLTKVRAGGMGLSNMRTRAELIGGQLEIVSAPGQGCRVQCRAEIKEQP